MSDATAIAILVLVCAMLLEGLVLGILVWVRGRQRDEERAARQLAAKEVDRLQRIIDLGIENARVKELKGEGVLAELLDHPDELNPGAR